MPTLFEQGALLEGLAAATRPQDVGAMVDALASLADVTAADNPSLLWLIDESLRQLGANTADAATRQHVTEVRRKLLSKFPTPPADGLPLLVPGREREHDPTLQRDGVLLWRHISAGSFRMGTEGGGLRGDEHPVDVELTSDFWAAAVPVTVGLYGLFQPRHAQWHQGQVRKLAELDPSLPATRVTWYAARMFVRWFQHRFGAAMLAHLDTRGSAEGWRSPERVAFSLPTEAEREYFARGGTTSRWSCGDDERSLADWAWFGEGIDGSPHPVATKRGDNHGLAGANPFGLFDVHGNVWDWCLDSYTQRLPGGRDPLVASVSGAPRVVRGGSCWYGADVCRSAFRDGDVPDFAVGFQGFRLVCVRVPPELGSAIEARS